MPKEKKSKKDLKVKSGTKKAKVQKQDTEVTSKKSPTKEQKNIIWIVAGLILFLCLCVILMSASAYYLSEKVNISQGTLKVTSFNESYFIEGNEISDYIHINSVVEIEPAIDGKNIFVTDENGILELYAPTGEYTITALYNNNPLSETITVERELLTEVDLPMESIGIYFYEFNTTLSNPPFDNKNTRQTFSYMLDREKMVDALDPSCNPRVADTLVPFDLVIKNNRDFDTFRYDLEKALTLTEDSDNFDMSFLSSSTGGDFGLYFFELYEESLTKLPIIKSIDKDSLEWDDFREAQGNQNYEFSNVYWVFDSNNILEFFKMYTGADSETGFESNEIDELIDQGEEALAYGDLKGYEEAVVDINNILVDEAVIMPVHFLGNCN